MPTTNQCMGDGLQPRRVKKTTGMLATAAMASQFQPKPIGQECA